MIVLTLPLKSERDVLYLRETIQKYCREVGFDFIDQLKMGACAAQMGHFVLHYSADTQALLSVWKDDAQHWWLDLRCEVPEVAAGKHFESDVKQRLDAVLRLMDNVSVRTVEGLWQLRVVRLLPELRHLISEEHLDFLKQHFQPVSQDTFFEEIKVQDLQLIDSLDELAKLKKELTSRNEELAIRNEQLQVRQREVERKNKELSEANHKIEHMNQMKSDFLSMVSHELRTPLSIIKESVLLVLDEVLGAVSIEQKKVLKSAQANIERLTRLINELLDVAKIEAGKVSLSLADVDVHALLQEMRFQYQTRAESRQIDFEVFEHERGLGVKADLDRLQQVLHNILGNAFKFTPEFGHVFVHVRIEGNAVEFCVEDSGPGIHPQDQERVFDKFQQVGRVHGPGDKGTGLGLSITKQLVEMMQGRIWVDSLPGRGAKFFVSLPQGQRRSVPEEVRGVASPLLDRLRTGKGMS